MHATAHLYTHHKLLAGSARSGFSYFRADIVNVSRMHTDFSDQLHNLLLK